MCFSASAAAASPDLWYNTLDCATQPWLADHAVDRTPLLPAAAIVEIALAAARARDPGAAALDVLDLEITKPMLLERDIARETRFSVSGERGAFELASRPRLSGDAWTVHATGRICAGSAAALTGPAADNCEGGASYVLAGAELYALTSRLGLEYGPAFQTVGRVSVQGADSAIVYLAPDTGRARSRGVPPRPGPAGRCIAGPRRVGGWTDGRAARGRAAMADRPCSPGPDGGRRPRGGASAHRPRGPSVDLGRCRFTRRAWRGGPGVGGLLVRPHERRRDR